MRRLGTGLVAIGLAVAATAAQQPSAQQPSFRSRSDVVRVFVTVTDRDGRLVTTLGQGDFEIRDEGKPQPIVAFDNTPQPIRLIVMLDVSGSMEGNLPLLRAASAELFARLHPGDYARVGSFGRDVTISESSRTTPACSRPPCRTRFRPTRLRRSGRRSTRRSAPSAATSDDRRAILVLSDGKDSGARSPWGYVAGSGGPRGRRSTRPARDRSSIARKTRT